MSGSKAYEKEKDVLLLEIELDTDYLVTCNVDGGWPIFSPIGHLGPTEREAVIKHSIEIGQFVGLVQLINKKEK